MSNFYITTTLPYINARPHLGFAWEILVADFLARYHHALGDSVIFNTGTDEHGQKVYDKAKAAGLEPQAYTDQLVTSFQDLKTQLDLSFTHFTRTTHPAHQVAAQEFWRRCLANGDIYKKEYTLQYCTGCELEKTASELVDGCCPLHPNFPLEKRSEENYFFRFSAYQEKLLYLYQTNPQLILGQGKLKEIHSFVERGLSDFSISRLRSKMPWGVPVPEDPDQVMYVWFDALVNYLSVLGWPNNTPELQNFWPGVQICGKDNLRQQAAMWQSMLLSAKEKTTKKILINGFITVDGAKMSKSLGNVIEPYSLVERFGREATRFLIASFPVLTGDVDLTTTRLDDYYTANLVNGLGNLCSRLAKLVSTTQFNPCAKPAQFSPDFAALLDQFQTSQALETINIRVGELDLALSQSKPWLITDQAEKGTILQPLIQQLLSILYDLQIFMPEVSQILLAHFTASKITPLAPLFPRLK